jgi:hypothetical protein
MRSYLPGRADNIQSRLHGMAYLQRGSKSPELSMRLISFALITFEQRLKLRLLVQIPRLRLGAIATLWVRAEDQKFAESPCSRIC